MRKSGIYLLPFLLAFQACDGPYENCPEYHYSDELKSNVIFNSGSYWIYQDSLLGITDSIHLDAQDFTFDEICKPQSHPSDVISQTFYSSFWSHGIDTFRYFVKCRASWNPSYNPDWDFLGYFNGSLASDDQYNYATLDSLYVKGVWYYNIKIFSNADHTFYWSKHTGLIRKEIKSAVNDTVYHFDLLRCQIN